MPCDCDNVIRKIRMIGTEFADVSDDELMEWICTFKPLVSKKQFGKLYGLALAYVICHKMKMAGKGDNILGGSITGSSGTIGAGFSASSVSDGGTSISFASSGVGNVTADAEWTLTVYGAQYLQLRKSLIIPIHVSGENEYV